MPKKVKDPSKWVTFNCETCGVEVERRKTHNSQRFCSNQCASKSNKKIQHIGVEGVVLDSGWEALFWGLCKFLKVPIERTDRALAIEWQPGCWYAPDFLVGTIWVEVKGLEDDDDPTKWDSWRVLRGQLAVLDRDQLDALRRCESYMVMDYLRLAAVPWKIMGVGDSDISDDRI